MKNLTVYVGTIKKCLNLEAYENDGEHTFLPDWEISTSCSKILAGYSRPNTETINEQAILIQKK